MIRTRKRSARTVALLAVSTAVAAGTLALPTASASAAPAAGAAATAGAGELVLPAAQRRIPRATRILTAGETGLLLAQEADDRLLWIDYATGGQTPLATRLDSKPVYNVDSGYFESPPFSFEPGHYGAGSDTVALYSAAPAPHVTLQKAAGEPVADIAIPQGQTYVGTLGDTVVTVTGERSTPTGFHLLKPGGAGGAPTDTQVTGFPAGAQLAGLTDGDARSVIVRYTLPEPADSSPRWALVDLGTGLARVLPDRPFPDDPWEVSDFRLAPQGLIRVREGRRQMELLDRAHPEAGPTRTVDTSVLGQAEYALLGKDTVLGMDSYAGGSGNDHVGSLLFGFTPDGVARVALPSARAQLVTAPDGSVLTVGTTAELVNGDIDWAVQRIARAAGKGDGAGAVEVKRVAKIAPVTASVYGLALGSGILNTADNSTNYLPADVIGAFRTTRLSAGGSPKALSTTVDRLVSGRDADCSGWDRKRCLEMFSGGDGNHGRSRSTEQGGTVLYRSGSADWGPRVTTGDSSPRLADLSGRFGVVDGASSGKQQVVEFKEPDSGATLINRPRVAAAVWGSTLWSGSATDGTVTRQTLPGGAAQTVFKTQGDCVPSEIQAVGRWVYWACPSDWGKPAVSGLYDQVSGRTAPAPAGTVLLGDNQLVRHPEGKGLELHDLSAGLPAGGAGLPTRVLVTEAQLGASTGRRTGWTVDRFGGHVAYVDDAERVHILPTGVTPSPMSAIDSRPPAGVVDLRTVAKQPWTGTWWLSKPAASWKLTIRDKATGRSTVVARGAEGRGAISASWNGKVPVGTLLLPGDYEWKLTAVPADGQGGEFTTSGPLTLAGPTVGKPRPKPVN
ncbi:ATP/GTP-binding protein [Streptomyces sp. NBC_00105]|uniref:ATP/GTP-binding protein n=1 Tax=Streptomyces sp. NBC_00105 TaxID=2903622 RepID=UPI00324EED7C